MSSIVTGALLALLAAAQAEPTTPDGPAAASPALETLLRQIPRSDDDADKRTTIAQTRMAEL